MTIKIKLELDTKTRALLKDHEDDLQRALDEYLLKHQAEIDAESHLVDAGILDETGYHFVLRSLLGRAKGKPE